GPPGTGKTLTATSIVPRAFTVDNSKILIRAPLNTDVDNFIRALLKSVEDQLDEQQHIWQNIIGTITDMLGKPQWWQRIQVKYILGPGRLLMKEEENKANSD
uniref:DNA2/NAM7 helicase helicase domain-containing protein n=1 Tax=Romanomermis culicivorax TaxID=13658 RepID=A0A915JT45_ROMCU